jgi:hypothetical protein
VVADARDRVTRAVRNAVREIEIKQEREDYRARIEQGGTVAGPGEWEVEQFRDGADAEARVAELTRVRA